MRLNHHLRVIATTATSVAAGAPTARALASRRHDRLRPGEIRITCGSRGS